MRSILIIGSLFFIGLMGLGVYTEYSFNKRDYFETKHFKTIMATFDSNHALYKKTAYVDRLPVHIEFGKVTGRPSPGKVAYCYKSRNALIVTVVEDEWNEQGHKYPLAREAYVFRALGGCLLGRIYEDESRVSIMSRIIFLDRYRKARNKHLFDLFDKAYKGCGLWTLKGQL